MADEPQGWHLSRSVPITLILTLFLLATTGVGGYYTMQAELRAMKSELVDVNTELAKIQSNLVESRILRDRVNGITRSVDEIGSLSNRLTAVETELTAVKTLLASIDRKLDGVLSNNR